MLYLLYPLDGGDSMYGLPEIIAMNLKAEADAKAKKEADGKAEVPQVRSK